MTMAEAAPTEPVDLDGATLHALVRCTAERIIASCEELTDLDRAIGDGDHGINMQRGMEAVLAALDTAGRDLPGTTLQSIGWQIVLSVGGASGPLFGTFFMAFGKALPPVVRRRDIAPALAAAVMAVKARGRSEEGEKTMLDVLGPVAISVCRGDDPSALIAVARSGAAATVPMRAVRGRASFLGDRSRGHMDPGARTVVLMVEAIVEVMTDRCGVSA